MATKLHTCKRCRSLFTVVDGRIKTAREVHEALYCPEFWEQESAEPACPMD